MIRCYGWGWGVTVIRVWGHVMKRMDGRHVTMKRDEGHVKTREHVSQWRDGRRTKTMMCMTNATGRRGTWTESCGVTRVWIRGRLEWSGTALPY